MSEKSYQIVVTGELMEGTYLPDVKAKLAAMFNTPAEKLDPLFSGNRVVIKKGLGEEGAKKYLAAVQAAGLRCAAEDMAEKAPQASPAATMADVVIRRICIDECPLPVKLFHKFNAVLLLYNNSR